MRLLSDEEIGRNLERQAVKEKGGVITDFFLKNATLYFNNIEIGTITNLKTNLDPKTESPDE